MGRAFFQSLKDYVGFSPRSSEQLQQAYVDVAPHVAAVGDVRGAGLLLIVPDGEPVELAP